MTDDRRPSPGGTAEAGEAGPPDRALDAALAANRETLKALFPLPPRPARAPAGAHGASPSSTVAPGEPLTPSADQATAAPGRARRRGGRASACLAVLVACALGLVAVDPAYRSERHATALGERRSVALADGSRVTLDTGSAVVIDWHLRGRRAVLTQGRAQFAVAPARGDALRRPFEVRAGDSRIRVVGTVFDVRLQSAQAMVTVFEGSVLVRQAPGVSPSRAALGADLPPVLLGPGQRWSAREGGAPAVQSVDTAAASAWRDGRLVFSDTPLVQALNDVQAYRRAPLRLHDDPTAPRLAALRLSGVFETARTDQLLDLLPRILPVRVERRSDGSVDVTPAETPLGAR